MSWPTTQRATTRQRILSSAARLFALEGLEQVSIDTIMKDAGLTRGAFYHHFTSKTELYNEAFSDAAHTGGLFLERSGMGGLQQIIKSYLRMDHRDGSQLHCPLAFMISDVARQDNAIRSNYSQAVSAFIARLEGALTSAPAGIESRQHAIQIAVGMIGGMALARAVEDEGLAEEILAACQAGCLDLLKT